jgi:protein AroM
MTRVGMLTIGQAPRPDLVRSFARLRPDVELVEAGALDGLSAASLPHSPVGRYPLTTRLADGTLITFDEADLVPLVRSALVRLEDDDVDATLLLSVGPFSGIRGRRPFVRPFDVVAGILRTAGVRGIAVLVPAEAQVEPSRRKFEGSGFEPVVRASDLTAAQDRLPSWLADECDAGGRCDVVVLDDVGHREEDVRRLQDVASVPVVDLGLTAAAVLATLV